MSFFVSVKDYGAQGDGSTDDTSAIQDALNASQSVFVPAGIYIVSATLVAQPNTRLFGQGAELSILQSSTDYGDMLQVGTSSSAGGAPMIDGLWFSHVHPGYTPGDSTMNGKCTSGASIRFYGCNGPIVQNCYLWYKPYQVVCEGGSKARIINNWFEGIWDPLYPAAQEGIACIYLKNTTAFGVPHDCMIYNNLIGGNVSPARSQAFGAATVSIIQNIGSQYGVYADSAETCHIYSNYFGGQSNNGIRVLCNQIAQNWMIWGNFFDGLGGYAIYVQSTGSSSYALNWAIYGNEFNGQYVALGAIFLDTNGSGTPSMASFRINDNGMHAYIKTPVVILGARNVMLKDNSINDYNCYQGGNNDAQFAAGVYLAGIATLIQTQGNLYGGGGNLLEPVANNHCKWGVVFQNGTEGTAALERSAGLGLSGGAVVSNVTQTYPT